jgi:cobalt-zinc-cadmium efflux system membrane fusion protein
MKFYQFIIIAIMLSGCDRVSKEHEEPASNAEQENVRSVTFTAAQLIAAGIQTGPPHQQILNEELVLQGEIEVAPENIVNLSFPMSGYLRSARVLPGTRVNKGQPLAEIEDMQFIQLQQDFLTAKEKFALVSSEYERYKGLNTSKASSDKVLQQSHTNMQTQLIQVNALSQKLQVIGIDPEKLSPENISRSVRILSPINGYVSKVYVSAGRYTAPTDPLFELINPDKIHLTLQVFEKDLASLSVGQKVMAYTNKDPKVMTEAEVVLITKNLDANRMAEVHCHFKKSNPKLVPGMFMNAKVSVAKTNALTVPEEAIVRWENAYYVFEEKQPGTFEMLPVTPGIAADSNQQLSAAGLNPATRIVLKNAYSVLMKMKNADAED